MLKKIIIGLGLVVIVAGVGVVFLASNAPKIIQGVIEDQGSRVTQVTVKLDAVDLSISDQKAGLRGLSIANPSGFKTKRAINLKEVSVKLGKGWTSDLIIVDEVMINAPEITYEIGSNGSNISAIQNNVQKFMNAMGGGANDSAGAETKPSSSPENGPKLVINHLYVKSGQINVSASLMQGKTINTPLPTIHLKDIGKDSGGASPAEVANKVLSAITKSASSAAGSIDLSSLGLADISGKTSKMLKGVMNGSGATGDAAKGALKDVGSAVKGLFGK